jgi:biotin transport system substrate-specific component
MPEEISTPISSSASWTSASSWLRNAAIVLAASVLLAVCARVSVPLWFTPIPLSLQPFGVLLLGLVLRPRMAGIATTLYLLEGAAGLPVFAPGPLGIAHLLGPTGGYLIAFPIAAVVISFLYRRSGNHSAASRTFAAAWIAAALGDLVILASGAMGLALLSHAGIGSILAGAILPFLPGEALKVTAAAGIAAGWRRARRRS